LLQVTLTSSCKVPKYDPIKFTPSQPT
jgi:hypothetical protein